MVAQRMSWMILVVTFTSEHVYIYLFVYKLDALSGTLYNLAENSSRHSAWKMHSFPSKSS